MHFKLAMILLISAVASAAPAPSKRELPVNPCDGINNKARKQLFQDNGATTKDIAISIQETSCYMSSQGVPDYPYGDNKSGASANFGPFKNNWYAIKLYCSGMSVFDGLDMNDYNSGRVLNEEANLAAAIQCQHQQISGADASGRQNGFWAVQRNGETVGGCKGDAVGDTYEKGVNQIIAYLNEKTGGGTHLDDNTVVNPQTQAC